MKMHAVQKLVSSLIIGVNLLSVTPEVIQIQNDDPTTKWSQEMIAEFNNEYAVMIDDKAFIDRLNHYPEERIAIIAKAANRMRQNNQCPGDLHSCWLKTVKNSRFRDFGDNKYFCTCNHTYDSAIPKNDADDLSPSIYRNIFTYPPSKLLDSFCVDPIEMEEKWVITGVRFGRVENCIHLQVQKTKLNDGRLYEYTSRWVIQNKCQNQKKIFTRNSDGSYDFLKFVLHDLMLPDGAVLTGVTLGESIVGRFLTDNGNINRKKPPVTVKMECPRTDCILKNFTNVLPSTGLIGKNKELSRPCKDHIVFNTTSFDRDFQQHIVPYVDLRKVVSQPADLIRGIGWYYSGAPHYGGFLGLRIFISD